MTLSKNLFDYNNNNRRKGPSEEREPGPRGPGGQVVMPCIHAWQSVLKESRRRSVYSRRSLFTVGGAHKWGRGTPLMVPVTIFWRAFIFVSNDFSKKKRDLKSVVHCPFNVLKLTSSLLILKSILQTEQWVSELTEIIFVV